MKKYLCFDGRVRSADGDEHHIPASRLPELYKVNPAESIFYKDAGTLRGYSVDQLRVFVRLYPRSDGNYTLDDMEAVS